MRGPWNYGGRGRPHHLGTGCTALHPRPLIEAFWNFEMPESLTDGYGLPPLAPELKQAILGGNIARILGLDVEE